MQKYKKKYKKALRDAKKRESQCLFLEKMLQTEANKVSEKEQSRALAAKAFWDIRLFIDKHLKSNFKDFTFQINGINAIF